VCVFFNFKMCFHCCVTFVFFKAAQQPRRTYSSVLRAFQGCPLGGPSKTPNSHLWVDHGVLDVFRQKWRFLFDFNVFLFRQVEKTTTWFLFALFRKMVGILNPWFVVASKHLYLLQNIRKTMFCISKYMLIRYQLAPSLHGFGLLISTHDCSFRRPMRLPPKTKADMAHHW